MNKMSSLLLCMLLASAAFCQTNNAYNVQQLFKENKFTVIPPKPFPITDGARQGISFTGLAWLTGVDFSTGTIEVDLQGRDVFQASFIGVAFHGVDDNTLDVVYFRPFNFRSEDPVRKIHAVQYMTLPDFPWNKLRDEQNGVYEKAVTPAPRADEWFHARIDVGADDINVYVNNAATPSLTVKKLNKRNGGKIGLWNEGVAGAFANLVITPR